MHSSPALSSTNTHSGDRAHLLVVEDEPLLRGLFSLLLSAAGYSVDQAENGFAALEQIRRRRPALILSDLNMPRMSGFELLSVVRRRFPAMRLIAMSGAFDGDKVPSGVAADAYYEKSGRQIGTLVEVIESILGSGSEEPEAAQPDVALWVSRHGTPIAAPHLLLSCPDCLRTFPHEVGELDPMHVTQTPCVFCAAPVSYALLDANAAHHPGYAPTEALQGR